jgi:hypothetical protein
MSCQRATVLGNSRQHSVHSYCFSLITFAVEDVGQQRACLTHVAASVLHKALLYSSVQQQLLCEDSYYCRKCYYRLGMLTFDISTSYTALLYDYTHNKLLFW